MSEDTLTDFAVAAYRDEGRWEVAPLPLRAAERLASLVAALRQLPSEGGAIGLVSVDDDFFVAVRLLRGTPRLLLSDASAADEWDIAQEIADEVDVDTSDDDGPLGDLAMFADLGLAAVELAAICGDLDLYPDEALARVAERLGFGEEFDRAVGVR